MRLSIGTCIGLLAVAACDAEPASPDDEGAIGGSSPTTSAGAPASAGGDAATTGGGSSSVAGRGGAGSGGVTTAAGSAGSDGSNLGGIGGSESTAGGSSGAGGEATGGDAGAAGSAGNAAAGGQGGAFTGCVSVPNPPSIYMIGDSTMSVYGEDRHPRMGWGQTLGRSFAPACAKVVDKALSGRSSKSFFDEGAWTPVKNALEVGDYVLIQFGHNDEKSDDAALYTEPQTTYKQYLTTYVNDARAKSATPILLTSINRNGWSGGKVSDSHGAYPPAVRELAKSLKVELIDLTALTKAYFERVGQAETTKLFMVLSPGQFPNYPSGVTDNTHLQEQGALLIGQLAMADAFAQKLTIATYLKAAPAAP